MTPERAIAKLDRQLARHGETVTYHAMVNGSQTPGSGTSCPAFVRMTERPDVVVGAVTQKVRKVVISPSSLAGQPADGDRIVLADGRKCRIESSQAFRLAGTIVRLELMVKG